MLVADDMEQNLEVIWSPGACHHGEWPMRWNSCAKIPGVKPRTAQEQGEARGDPH